MVRIVLTLGVFCSFAAFAGAGPEPLAPYGGAGDWPVGQSGEVIFDNIEPNGGLGGTSPRSQLDTTYAGGLVMTPAPPTTSSCRRARRESGC